MTTNPKVEASLEAIRLAKQLTDALAKAQEVGVELAVSCEEMTVGGRRVKQVLVRVQNPEDLG
ncbi:hypothetical protein CYG48_05915 [Neorhizobium sp. SOG26]|nr:hypothetical protein CYG48_05915 [Neorhizobium sp. SOG26]